MEDIDLVMRKAEPVIHSAVHKTIGRGWPLLFKYLSLQEKDVMQDVRYHVLRALRKFRHGKVSTYIYVVAQRRCLSLLRHSHVVEKACGMDFPHPSTFDIHALCVTNSHGEENTQPPQFLACHSTEPDFMAEEHMLMDKLRQDPTRAQEVLETLLGERTSADFGDRQLTRLRTRIRKTIKNGV